jgi:hypothetical protein
MPASQWHKFYTAQVAAPPAVLFGLLADMPNAAVKTYAEAHPGG